MIAFTTWTPLVAHGQEGVRLSQTYPSDAIGSGARYDLSFDLPHQGMLDSYHFHRDAQRNPIPVSLYVLRNTLVAELLDLRRQIKLLLGGTEGLQAISPDKPRSFAAPAETISLYLLPGLERISDLSRLAPPGARPEDSDVAKYIEAHDDSEMGDAIRWLSEVEPRYDQALRKKLVAGLIFASSQVARYDAAIKFLNVDFWKTPEVRMAVYEENVHSARGSRLSQGVLTRQSPASLSLAIEQKKRESGYPQLIEDLKRLREIWLNQYRVLGVPHGGMPLYKSIYRQLHAYGFPEDTLIQRAPTTKIATQAVDIELPDDFDQGVQRGLRRLTEEGGDQFLTELTRAINPLINSALLSMLDENTEMLKRYTAERHYTGNKDSALLELAKEDSLWVLAAERYRYLGIEPELYSAHQQFDTYFASQERKRDKLRKWTYGLGIAASIASILTSFGGSTAVLAVSNRLLLLSNAIFIGQSTADYLKAAADARLSRGLYVGTSRVGSFEEVGGAGRAEKDALSFLIINGVLGFCDIVRISNVARHLRVAMIKGKNYVTLSANEIKAWKQSLEQTEFFASKLAPGALGFIRNVRTILSGNKQYMTLKAAVEFVAKKNGMAVEKVWDKIMAHPILGKWVSRQGEIVSKELRVFKRIVTRPEFLDEFIKLEASGFAIGIGSEIQGRGDAFNDELGYVVMNSVSGALATFSVVHIYFRNSKLTAARASVGDFRPRTLFDFTGKEKRGRHYTLVERGRAFRDRAVQFGVVGLMTNGITQGAFQGLGIAQGDQTWLEGMERGTKNIVYPIIFTMLWGNARYQLVETIATAARKNLSKDAANLIIDRAWFVNNNVGGYTYVTWARAFGVQKGGETAPLDLPEELGGMPLDAQDLKLVLEKSGGAYMKAHPPGPFGEAFDFLN